MTHSTGVKERLGRSFGIRPGDEKYAREELVAEFTAALCGATLGFATTPRDENAAYLKHWLGALRQEPVYLFDILVDVNRAAPDDLRTPARGYDRSGRRTGRCCGMSYPIFGETLQSNGCRVFPYEPNP